MKGIASGVLSSPNPEPMWQNLARLCLRHAAEFPPCWPVGGNKIHRILKNGGIAIISDFIHNNEYRATFSELGMQIEKMETFLSDTYQPLTIIKAVKH